LYPASCRLFEQVERRMGEFIGRALSLGPEEARALQKRYFREHGTTLRGLMTVNGIDPAEFLSYVHDIDVSVVPVDPTLAAALGALDGRKLVFTNGSRAHARRILDRLGSAGHIEAIVDIVEAGYRPKPNPEPYQAMVAAYGIEPARAAMVEDIAANLAPAHALGMTTIWLRGELEWAQPAPGHGDIDHVVDDLPS